MKRAFLPASWLVVAVACVVTALAYLPGLSGPWLVDDEYNLGIFKHFSPGNAPYHDIIFSNPSGPLGRAVSMASFAANHALGLFSPYNLKATNLGIHLLCGVLLFLLLRLLFRQRPPLARLTPDMLAACIAAWWLLLPMNISAVLYIVQRMALVSTFFALAACLAYASGRRRLADHPRTGKTLIILAVLVFLPLSVFAKESGVCCIAFLALIELFFFQPRHLAPRLAALVAAAAALGAFTVVLAPRFMTDGYLGRDFSLGERLLTEPRVLASYIRDIFLPNSARMGLFHDDFAVSHGLLAPPDTLLALLALAAVLGLALRTADSRRWWPVSFGILFYFAGHLVESTIVPLELYFEHRNYLPQAGLLIAIAIPVASGWPWHNRLLVALFATYLALLAFASTQQAAIWGNEGLLLRNSALNHPLSTRADDAYVEYLVGQGNYREAIAESGRYAATAPEHALASHLHALSVYCRTGAPLPSALLTAAVDAPLPPATDTELLGINLAEILRHIDQGPCRAADLAVLSPRLVAWDALLVTRYGTGRTALWHQRMITAWWLIRTGRNDEALHILADIWNGLGPLAATTPGLTEEMRAQLSWLQRDNALGRPESRQELARLLEQLP
jgi:hypothetical protein